MLQFARRVAGARTVCGCSETIKKGHANDRRINWRSNKLLDDGRDGERRGSRFNALRNGRRDFLITASTKTRIN